MTSSTNLSTVQIPLGDNKGTIALLYRRSNTQPSHTQLPPTVLFLPFWGGTARLFAQILTSPALGHVNALAVSYAGTGTSVPPNPDKPALHSIEARAQDLATLLQHETARDLIPNERLIIVAHSMSAKIAYALMDILESQSMSVAVDALLLIAPAPPGPLVLPNEMRASQGEVYTTHESASWALKNVLVAKNDTLDERTVEWLAQDCVGMTNSAKRGWPELGMSADLTKTLREIMARGDSKILTKVKVLVGKEDQVETPEKVQKETVDVLRGFRWAVDLQLVHDCGHLIPVEKPDVIVQEILALQDSLEG